jgi:nucleoside phosphorylase
LLLSGYQPNPRTAKSPVKLIGTVYNARPSSAKKYFSTTPSSIYFEALQKRLNAEDRITLPTGCRPMAEPALTYRDYTVGWICALEVEQAAARALLDSEHSRLPSIAGDSNIYRFGSVNGHNVVIACLPDGETGNNPAATVAARMAMNFPSLKFGLMVGIGGGAPSPPDYNDIRLGDVVVSSATGEFGGVVQYDRGKTVQKGVFARTGSLNRPPEVLRQAVTDLRATYRLKRGRFTEYLSQMVLEFGTFASPLATQGSQDILFRPDYDHPKESSASTCEFCEAAQRIQRSPRSPNPVIHYGTIASGNQVMRNGLERDQISKELGGVLCFEMEAAGLMNTFPCLVIRGICDYSDSHKNKNWQAYAAAVAAAYTKELLGEIEPALVGRTPNAAAVMSESLDAIKRNVTEVKDVIKGKEMHLSFVIILVMQMLNLFPRPRVSEYHKLDIPSEFSCQAE